MKIGVKYCGNCNPLLDTPGLVKRLKAWLSSGSPADAEGVEFVSYSAQEYDALLLLNGCGASCAEVPEYTGTVIRVDGLTVDWWPVEPDEIYDAVLAKITFVKKG